MQHELIADLMLKHMAGTATPDEEARLELWKNEKPGRKREVEAWAAPEQLKKEWEENWPDKNTIENGLTRLHDLLKT